MKTIGSTIIMLALASSLFADNGKELKLASPDGTHEIVFYQKQVSPAVNELCYRVDYKSQPVVNESRAGLELDNRIWEMALGVRNLKQPACWMDNLEVDSVTYQPETNLTWQCTRSLPGRHPLSLQERQLRLSAQYRGTCL